MPDLRIDPREDYGELPFKPQPWGREPTLRPWTAEETENTIVVRPADGSILDKTAN